MSPISLATALLPRRDPDALNIYTSAGYWVDPSLWHPEFNGTFPSPEVGFISPETEEIFAGLAAATTFEERKALGEDLQMAFYDQVAMLNLGYIYRLVAKSDKVHDPYNNLALGNLTLHGPRSPTAVTDLEDLPRQPCGRSCLDRSVRRPDCYLSSTLCLHRAAP